MTEKTLSVVDAFNEWPKIYCTKTDQFRLVTQKDVDDMQRVVRTYGYISQAVKSHSAEVQIKSSASGA